MSDLQLPPPAEDPGIPPWLRFPPDMQVNGEGLVAAWMVKPTTGLVWVWLRTPVMVITQPFSPDNAMQLSEQIASASLVAAQLGRNADTLLQVRTPIIGPDGKAIG